MAGDLKKNAIYGAISADAGDTTKTVSVIVSITPAGRLVLYGGTLGLSDTILDLMVRSVLGGGYGNRSHR